MIYTHVSKQGPTGTKSPLEKLFSKAVPTEQTPVTLMPPEKPSGSSSWNEIARWFSRLLQPLAFPLAALAGLFVKRHSARN